MAVTEAPATEEPDPLLPSPAPRLPSRPVPPAGDWADFLATSFKPLPQPGHLTTWPIGVPGTSIAVPQVGHFTILAIQPRRILSLGDVRARRSRPAFSGRACYRKDGRKSKKFRG